MNEQRDFSDEELTAYLDNETDRELAAAISVESARSAALRERLSRLSIDKTAVKTALEVLLDSAPDYPMSRDDAPVSARSYTARRIALVAMVALGCIGIGFFAGKLNGGSPPTSWQDYAASYHVLYTADTLAPIDQTEELAKSELARISSKLGKVLSLSEVRSTQFRYKRAQVLGFRGRPLIQLAYTAADGTPVALCLYRMKMPKYVTPRLTTMEGMASATWSKDGIEFLLIGGADTKLIERAAFEFFGKM